MTTAPGGCRGARLRRPADWDQGWLLCGTVGTSSRHPMASYGALQRGLLVMGIQSQWFLKHVPMLLRVFGEVVMLALCVPKPKQPNVNYASLWMLEAYRD